MGYFFFPYNFILLPVSWSDNPGNNIEHPVKNPGLVLQGSLQMTEPQLYSTFLVAPFLSAILS